MPKATLSEYLTDLLRQKAIKSVDVREDEIFCQCPFHLPIRNHTTFSVMTKEKTVKGKTGCFYHCFSCGVNGAAAGLVAHLTGVTLKKAERLLLKKTSLVMVSLGQLTDMMTNLRLDAAAGPLAEIELPPVADDQTPMLHALRNRSRMYHGVVDVDALVATHGLFYCGSGRMAGRIIMPIRVNDAAVCYDDRHVDRDHPRKSLHVKGLRYGEVFHGKITGRKKVILVESGFNEFQIQFAMMRRGVDDFDVLSMMGTSFTDSREGIIIKNYEEAVVATDNDAAGLKSMRTIYQKLKDSIEVTEIVTSLPEGNDYGVMDTPEIIRNIKRRKPPKSRSYLDMCIDESGFRV